MIIAIFYTQKSQLSATQVLNNCSFLSCTISLQETISCWAPWPLTNFLGKLRWAILSRSTWGYLLRAVRRLTLRWKLQILSYFYSFQSFQSIFGLYMMKQYVGPGVGYKKFVSFASIYIYWIYSNMVTVRGAAKSTDIMYMRDNAQITMKSTK